MSNNKELCKKESMKIDVKRMEELFHETNPYMPTNIETNSQIVRDYVYIPQKRVIA